MCCGEVRDEEQSMMLGPLEHGPCFEAPLWTGASRDQTAESTGLVCCLHSRSDRHYMHEFAHLIMV